MKSIVAASLTSVALAACGTVDSSGDHELGTPENPVPVEKGAYQVTSRVDLSVEAILPQQAEAVVATLRDFSMNPAHALFTFAQSAGVPAVGTIEGALPQVLKDKIEGWIN